MSALCAVVNTTVVAGYLKHLLNIIIIIVTVVKTALIYAQTEKRPLLKAKWEPMFFRHSIASDVIQ